MKQQLPVARRIARAIFVGIGAALFLVAFLVFALDSGSRALVMQHNWHDAEFRGLLTGVTGLVLVGLMLLVGARMIVRAKLAALALLTVGNALLLYWCWYGDKEVVLVPPLILSLACLLFEEAKLLEIPLFDKV